MRSFNSSIDSKLALLRSARVVPPSSKPGPVQESPLFAVSQAEPLPEQLLTSLQASARNSQRIWLGAAVGKAVKSTGRQSGTQNPWLNKWD